jgi:DNA-binding MarR family transcriptional regulator
METNYDFDRSIGFMLFDTSRLMSTRFDQRAKGLGLTRAQCHVIVHLVRQEGMNQARLAELLELEPISLARCLDRMEQAGWIERRPDPTDRRARLLYMTEKAKPVFERILEVAYQVRQEALSGLAPSERDQLLDLLQRVRGNLSEKSLSEKSAAVERPLIVAGAK